VSSEYVEIVSDEPLTNATVRFCEGGYRAWNTLESPTSLGTDTFTDDFVYEDRRVGAFNFGRLNATEFMSAFKAAWEAGAGRPRFSVEQVVAVRGERLAVIVDRTDFGNDMQVELIGVNQLDRSLRRLQRVVTFDLDDVDAAIAELDRLHAQIDE
jgi:hypothetical protein